MQYAEDFKALKNLILNDLNSDSINSFIQQQNQPSNSAGSGNGMVSAVGGVGQQPSEQNAANSNQGSGVGANREVILKKALKCKQLEDDNKKLRKLLINQIEGSDKLREETQNTISTLREDFDTLLKELAQYKQREEQQMKGKPGKGSAGVPNLNLGSQ